AMDNQVYVGLCSPARDMTADYNAWGHSMIVNPNAEVLSELDEKEGIVYADLDGETIEQTRKGIPIYTQRRFDVYPDVSKGDVKYEEKLGPVSAELEAEVTTTDKTGAANMAGTWHLGTSSLRSGRYHDSLFIQLPHHPVIYSIVMYTPSSYSSSQSGKPPTWPMVPLSELDIKIPVRTSSLGPLLQPEPHLSSSSPDPSNLGHYNDGTLSRRSTVRGTVTFHSPDVSPKTQSPPSSSSIEKDKQNLERAVTGLHNLMEEALTVAQDAAQNNRSQDVAQILDEAKIALRKSSTIHGYMAPPLRIDDTESDEYFSSDEYDQGSDSDADIESNISSTHPKPKASNVGIPAAYTKSNSGLSLEPAPTASVPPAVPRHSIRQRSVVHPILSPPFESDGKRPSSQEAIVGPSSSEDFSMTQTPPQMYSKLSMGSTMHDWAYTRRPSTRRDLRGGSEPGPVSQDETVLPPPAGETSGVVLPPVIPQDASVKTPEQIPHEPLRISVPGVPKRRSLRPVRSDPQLSSTPSPPPQPTLPYAVYDPRHYVTPDYPSAQYPAVNSPEVAGPAPAPPKRWKPKAGASRIFESPYYHVPERREVPVALPASAQPPPSGQPTLP
ncbi:hypothetical protein KCU73_g11737, partial [Aureobasidium melanogenum]